MSESTNFACPAHPTQEMISVCPELGCTQRLPCLECLATHDPSHSKLVLTLKDALQAKDFMEGLDLRRQNQLVAVGEALRQHQEGKERPKTQIDKTLDLMIRDLTLKKDQVYNGSLNKSGQDQADPKDTPGYLERMRQDLLAKDLKDAPTNTRLERMVYLHRNLLAFQSEVAQFADRVSNFTEPLQALQDFREHLVGLLADLVLTKPSQKSPHNLHDSWEVIDDSGRELSEEEQAKPKLLEATIVDLEKKVGKAKEAKQAIEAMISELRDKVAEMTAEKSLS